MREIGCSSIFALSFSLTVRDHSRQGKLKDFSVVHVEDQLANLIYLCLSVTTLIAWFQSPTLSLTVAGLTIFCNLGGKKVENKIERKGYNNVQNNSCLSPEKLDIEL